MSEVNIRPFQYGKSDLEILDTIDRIVFGEEHYESHSLRQMIDLFAELTFIAESQGEPAGYILGGASTDFPPEGWVLTLAVPDQNLFTARLLIERLVQEIKTRKTSQGLWMTADPKNDFIKQICADLDFRIVEKVDDYLGSGRDRLLMRKSIG